MTARSQRLLLAVIQAIGGVSWGDRFGRVVDALEGSGCSGLLGVLADAGQLSDRAAYDRAWGEIHAALGTSGAGLVVLDLVVELGHREDARGGVPVERVVRGAVPGPVAPGLSHRAWPTTHRMGDR